jgi:hypothetical protein
MTQLPLPQVISREAAHAAGLRRFFTGNACKRGHVAERYVSTNACIACLGQTFKFRRNPWSKELEPFRPETLWIPRTYTPQQRRLLEVYMQRCIYEHCKALGLLTEGITLAANAQLERYGVEV